MQFKEITNWGYVNPGTRIVDSSGNKYVVEPQNDAGFLRLQNISSGEHKVFEAMDEIDHNEYRLA